MDFEVLELHPEREAGLSDPPSFSFQIPPNLRELEGSFQTIAQTEEGSDEEDDGINVIIDSAEVRRSATNSLLLFKEVDFELKREIESLIQKSICLNSQPTITILIQQTLILVPITTPLSSRLQNLIWAPEILTCRPYDLFPRVELFNSTLTSMKVLQRPNEVIGFLGVHYKKPMAVEGDFSKNLVRFDDFCLVIVENEKVVAYAIHGKLGSFGALIQTWKPRRVYYNAEINDALDVFLKYPHTPFSFPFSQTHLTPILNGQVTKYINTLAFCTSNNLYCSLCQALQTTIGFFKGKSSFKQPTFVQKMHYKKNKWK